jgi:hypothetical protein
MCEIALVLWGSEVDFIEQGTRVRLTEGRVYEYLGRPQSLLGQAGLFE